MYHLKFKVRIKVRVTLDNKSPPPNFEIKIEQKGLFFLDSRNEYKKFYVTTKTVQIVKFFPVGDLKRNFTKASEQDLFFWAGWNENKKYYATIKTENWINIAKWYTPIPLPWKIQDGWLRFD